MDITVFILACFISGFVSLLPQFSQLMVALWYFSSNASFLGVYGFSNDLIIAELTLVNCRSISVGVFNFAKPQANLCI